MASQVKEYAAVIEIWIEANSAEQAEEFTRDLAESIYSEPVVMAIEVSRPEEV